MPIEFFEDDDCFTGPPITPELIQGAETRLGVRLPAAYKNLLSERNGGSPRRRCFMTDFETSWAPGFFEISALLGVGGERGIDGDMGSDYLVGEWDYPDIGVVICVTAAAGPDTVMLDYRDCEPGDEPSVAYIDEDRVPRTSASSFDGFVSQLVVTPEDI